MNCRCNLEPNIGLKHFNITIVTFCTCWQVHRPWYDEVDPGYKGLSCSAAHFGYFHSCIHHSEGWSGVEIPVLSGKKKNIQLYSWNIPRYMKWFNFKHSSVNTCIIMCQTQTKLFKINVSLIFTNIFRIHLLHISTNHFNKIYA